MTGKTELKKKKKLLENALMQQCAHAVKKLYSG